MLTLAGPAVHAPYHSISLGISWFHIFANARLCPLQRSASACDKSPWTRQLRVKSPPFQRSSLNPHIGPFTSAASSHRLVVTGVPGTAGVFVPRVGMCDARIVVANAGLFLRRSRATFR